MRILVTGSRDWTDDKAIAEALIQGSVAEALRKDTERIIVVHGGARGTDLLAHYWATKWGWITEAHPAGNDPKARNQRMVDLGADVCLAFATRWASGTGHCARAARRAGIHTVDYGVSTLMEDRP